jgi:hypothetical protein
MHTHVRGGFRGFFFFEAFRGFCCFAIDATSHGNSQGKTAGDALNLDPVGCLWLMAAQ